MPTTIVDHSAAPLSIYQMVLNRLPFLEDTPENEQLISYFIYEIMSQLNVCFQVDPIGLESGYSTVQKSIIADIVSVYIMMMQASAIAGAADSSAGSKFISKTKAGSVEVEWDQFDIKLGGTFALPPESMMQFFKKQAINKAMSLGCIIDVCDDCSMTVMLQQQSNITPLIVYPSSGCGCCDA